MTTDLSHRTLIYGGAPLTLAGPPHDRYFREASTEQTDLAALSWVAKHRLQPDSPVFDIGANFGLTASILARHTAGPILAFEPLPGAFQALTATLNANHAGNVEPLNLALGVECGAIGFFEDPNAAAASHVVSPATAGRQANRSVAIRTVDSVVAERRLDRLDLMKIDVEGYELDVLEGARRTLERLKPSVLLEVNAFTTICLRDRHLPRAVKGVVERFPYTYRFVAGSPQPVRDAGELLAFLHDLLVRPGCVDELYLTFTRI